MQVHTTPPRDGHESFDGRASISHIDQLMRDVLRESLRTRENANGTRDADVRRMVRAVCREARECNTHVEGLLILFKQTLTELPEARQCTHATAREALGRVVTLCIEEYYAPVSS